jgi:hypothetical protein
MFSSIDNIFSLDSLRLLLRAGFFSIHLLPKCTLCGEGEQRNMLILFIITTKLIYFLFLNKEKPFIRIDTIVRIQNAFDIVGTTSINADQSSFKTHAAS